MHLYSNKSRRGTMLIVVLGLLVALFVIGTSFSYIVLAERKASTNYLDRQRALDLAYDGVEYSIARLRAESTREHYEGLSDKEFEYDPVSKDVDGPNFARRTLDSRDVRVSWNKTTTTTNDAKDANPDRGWIDFNNNGRIDGSSETGFGGDKVPGQSAPNARNFLSGVTLFGGEGYRIDSNPRESRAYREGTNFGASGTYEDLGDYTRVKVIDAAAQFNLNSFKGDRLAEMLMVLGVEIDKWVSGGKGGDQYNPFQSDIVDAIVKTHDEAGNFFTNKEQLRPIWDGSASSRKPELYELAMNFVTVNNWRDNSYREYTDNAAAANDDKAKNPSGKTEMENWREGYANPGQLTGGRDGWPDWQPDASTASRAPINVNTAPKPVLVMLFLGLEARARLLYFKKANTISEEDTLYKELFGVAPQRLVFGTPDIGRQNGVPLNNGTNESAVAAPPGSTTKPNQAIFQLVDIGPLTGAPTGGKTNVAAAGADYAGALADAIIEMRKKHAFTSWQDFDSRFCYERLLGLSLTRKDVKVPDLVGTQRGSFTDPGNVSGIDYKLLPKADNCRSAANPLLSTDAAMNQTAFRAWYWKSCVDMIRASLNPNNTVARYNADYPYHKNVDRMDLVKSCPPVCFSSMGIYEVVSQGEVLAPVTRGINTQETATTTGGTSEVRMPVARRQVRTLVEIYTVVRHTSQYDFMQPIDPDVATNAATTAGTASTRNIVAMSRFGTMTGPYSADERAAGCWNEVSTSDTTNFPEDTTYLGIARKGGYNKNTDLSHDFGYISQRPQDRTPMQPLNTGLTFHARFNEGLDARTYLAPGNQGAPTGIFGLNSWDGGGQIQDAPVNNLGNKPTNDRVKFDDFVNTATPRKIDRANANAQDEFANADKAEGAAAGATGGESTRYATLMPDGAFLRASAIRAAFRYQAELANTYGKRGIARVPRLKLLRYPNATKDTDRPFGPIAAGMDKDSVQDQMGNGIAEVRKRLEGNGPYYSGTDAHNQAMESLRQSKANCPYYQGTLDFWIKWDFPPQGSDGSGVGQTVTTVCMGEIDPASQNFSGLFGATAYGRADFFDDSGQTSNPARADKDFSDATDSDRNDKCDIEGVQFFIFKEPGGILRFSRLYFCQALAADVPASIWSQTGVGAGVPPRQFGNWRRRVVDENYPTGPINRYTGTNDICPVNDPNDLGFKYCRTDGWVDLNTITPSEFSAGLRTHDWHRLTLSYNSKSTTQPYDFWIDGKHVTVTFRPDDDPANPKGLINDGHHEPNPGAPIPLDDPQETEYLFFRNTTPLLEVNPEDRLTIGCLFRRQPDFNDQATYNKYFLDIADPSFTLKPTRPVFKFDSNLVAVANATIDDMRISSTVLQPSFSVNSTDYASYSRYLQSSGPSSANPTNFFEQAFLPTNPNGATGAMLTAPVRVGTLSWTEYRPDWDPYMGRGIDIPKSARVIIEWGIFDNIRNVKNPNGLINFSDAKSRGIIDDPINPDVSAKNYWARGGMSLNGVKINAGNTVGVLVYRIHFISPDATVVPVANMTAYVDDVTLTVLTPPRKLAFVIEY